MKTKELITNLSDKDYKYFEEVMKYYKTPNDELKQNMSKFKEIKNESN